MTKKIVATLFILIFAQSCSKKDYTLFQTPNEPKPVIEKHFKTKRFEYKILPQDRITINLYKYPEISPTTITTSQVGASSGASGVLVDSKGYISLPLVGRVKLAGLTQREASKMLEKKYATYLTDPSLYLEVLGKRIYILGEVAKKGSIKIDREKLTIIEAIALAGGFTDTAVRDNVIVLTHDKKDKLTMRTIDLTHFDTLNMTNLLIKPNDIIYVKPNKWKGFKLASSDYLSIFKVMSQTLQPFITLLVLKDRL